MARQITSAVASAILLPEYRPVFFAELNFDSGAKRIHSWIGNLTVDGFSFNGIGELTGATRVTESPALTDETITLGLRGVDDAFLTVARDEHVYDRLARIWFGFLDENYDLIADPDGPYIMRMDSIEIVRDPDESEVLLTLKTAAVLWNEANISRYTDEEQQRLFPGDRFFEFGPEMEEKELVVSFTPAAKVVSTETFQSGTFPSGDSSGEKIPPPTDPEQQEREARGN